MIAVKRIFKHENKSTNISIYLIDLSIFFLCSLITTVNMSNIFIPVIFSTTHQGRINELVAKVVK